MQPILETRNIRFAYDKTEVLCGVDLAVGRGSVTGIIGPNGSGKSTFVRILAGSLTPDQGSVYFEGRDLSSMKRRTIAQNISVVPQEVVFHFPFTVYDFVMMGRHPYQKLTPFESEQDAKCVARALEQTGLSGFERRSVLDLSGGEKQRTVLASALAQDTPVMLLDEPTASLDLKYQVHIHKILVRLARDQGMTVVLVTHDLNLGALYCDRLVLMNQGQIVADGPPDQVCTEANVLEYYGVKVVTGTSDTGGGRFILPVGD